jgi:hypothetical protein
MARPPRIPVIELLRNYFGITLDDDNRQRREKRIAKLLAVDLGRVFSRGRRRARETVTGKVLALDRSLEDTLPYLFAMGTGFLRSARSDGPAGKAPAHTGGD